MFMLTLFSLLCGNSALCFCIMRDTKLVRWRGKAVYALACCWMCQVAITAAAAAVPSRVA